MKDLKVLHLPHEICGNPWGLAQGERALGLDSKVLVTHTKHFPQSHDYCLNIDQIQIPYGKITKLLWTFLNIRNQYDVFHFNFGSSLVHIDDRPRFHLFELPYYPKKARLFATYNGCDARQKYPTMARTNIAPCHNSQCTNGMCNSGQWDKWRQSRIEKMSRYVTHIWAVNPDLLHFLPPEKSSFLPYTVNSYDPTPYIPNFEGKLKILHAPSNRITKGTDFILTALDRLQKKYPNDFEVILVENRSHKEALVCYQQADLVIDQILIGWYGAFAVEVMLMGKPVIARIAEEDLSFIPDQMAKEVLDSVINANPFTLYDTLERCLNDRHFLRERSKRAREYAMRWHNPRYVASLTKEKYESLPT